MTRSLLLLLLATGCTANGPQLPSDGLAPDSGVDVPISELIALQRTHSPYSGGPGNQTWGYSTSPASIAPAPNGQPVILPMAAEVRTGEWITFQVAWPGHSLAGLTWFWTADGGAYPATDTGREFQVRWSTSGRKRVAVMAAGGVEPGIVWVEVRP